MLLLLQYYDNYYFPQNKLGALAPFSSYPAPNVWLGEDEGNSQHDNDKAHLMKLESLPVFFLVQI